MHLSVVCQLVMVDNLMAFDAMMADAVAAPRAVQVGRVTVVHYISLQCAHANAAKSGPDLLKWSAAFCTLHRLHVL